MDGKPFISTLFDVHYTSTDKLPSQLINSHSASYQGIMIFQVNLFIIFNFNFFKASDIPDWNICKLHWE